MSNIGPEFNSNKTLAEDGVAGISWKVVPDARLGIGVVSGVTPRSGIKVLSGTKSVTRANSLSGSVLSGAAAIVSVSILSTIDLS